MRLLIILAVLSTHGEAPPYAAVAQEQENADLSLETVLSGLHNPCAVAVQPETGHVFVSDSAAGRVVRFDPVSGTSSDVVIGFSQESFGDGPQYKIGPLGLAFITTRLLAVGGGDLPIGSELLRFYELPEDGKPISAEQMKYALGPLAAGEETKSGEGDFYALAATDQVVYVTSQGDDTKGWVSKADLEGGKPSNLRPFIATKVTTQVDAPVGIAINYRGHIVIGQMGELNVPQDSRLCFYHASDGRMLMNLETRLFDIVGMAYSQSGRGQQLYAVDFAWMDAKQGGLFRLDSAASEHGTVGVKAVKLLSLDKPSALAFDRDGTLYVTIFGTAEEGSTEKPGKLLRVKGNF